MPVATVVIDGGANAGILAARILAASDAALALRIEAQMAEQALEALRDPPDPRAT